METGRVHHGTRGRNQVTRGRGSGEDSFLRLVAGLVLVVPSVEVDVEDDYRTGVEPCQDESVVRRHRYRTNRAVHLLKSNF